MTTTDSVPIDTAPLMPISQQQAEAAARTVIRLAPDDHRAILAALGLLHDGDRIGPPPGILTGVQPVRPKLRRSR